MVLACWCWCFKKPRKLPNVEEDAEFHLGKFKKFSLQELEVATESFSNEHIIGRCGFRTFDKVYKGILEDGFLVAIKRLKSQNTAAAEFQFQTVVVTNSMAVHQNLLQLHGLCITPTERLLAYPYMANGSVASHLKDRPPSQPSLDWQIRKRIALGSAKGLSYLHENCNPRIIHCDVKASNIFLNEDFEAFIGDFASAKLIDCKETHITTTVCGTIGYIAPEYLSNGRCSEKIDVYGYGIILLELITGQKAFDLSRLSDFVKRFVKENKLEMLVDPDLQNNYVEAEMEQLIQVALFCTMYQSSYANIGKQAFQRHFRLTCKMNVFGVLPFSEVEIYVFQLLEESLSGASDTSAMAFSCWCCRGPPILSFEGDSKIHPDPNADVSQLRRFSLEELQLATNYFSNENFLGRGGFGKVYRGQLDDGSLIAVKRLEREPTPGGELQFQTTTEIINMAMHRNVIRLRGFCMTHSERLLVYPYMANGSVASHLRGRTASQPALNWPTRKQIALGSAEGLSYLHDECNPRIIHRDVKAANILLDEEFKAVVGDFGLAKLMDYNDTHITTDVYGTPGHIAPEYLYTGICSEKTDVYGYGIMILELITGQRAVDLAWIAAGDDLLLLDWVKVVLKENRLEELADPDLQGNYSQAEMEQLIKVALLCTQGSPLYRPKMSEVTRMLEGYGVAERWNEWLEMESSDVELGVSFQPVSYYVADSTELLAAIELSGPR